jgi:hypothetical protein
MGVVLAFRMLAGAAFTSLGFSDVRRYFKMRKM